MQKTKPIRFEAEQKTKNDKIKPQIIAIEGTKEFDELTNKVQIKEGLLKNQTKFYSFFTFIILVFITVLLGSFFDVYLKFKEIFSFNQTFAIIYVSFISLIFLMVFKFIFTQRGGLKKLKKVDNFKLRGQQNLKKPSKESVFYFKDILKEYENSPDEKVRNGVLELRNRLKSSILYEELLPLLNEHLMKPLDEKAEKLILKYSRNSAIITAISPIAIVDILILFWQNYKLSIEIAKIYGFKPTFFSNLIIFKKVIENLIFAGVSEGVSESVTSSLLTKLSYSISQGIVNGVLTIRVGLATMKLCRPVPFTKEENFFTKLFNLMLSSVKKD